MRTRSSIAFIAVMALVGTLAASAGAQPAFSAVAQPAFVEDFEDGDVAGWLASQPGLYGNGTFEAVADPASPSGGNYVGRQTFGWSCIGWGHPFDPVTPDYFRWYFRADGETAHDSGLQFAVLDGIGGWLGEVNYHQGFLRTYLSGSGYVEIMPASMGTWYLIELRNIDWDLDTFDIWVDGVEKVVGNPFETHIDYVSVFINYACPWASGPSYVDDITFGFDTEGPVVTDVVASPNPAAVAQPVTLSATLDDSQTGNSKIVAAEYAVDGGLYTPMSASDGAFDAPTEAVEAALGSFGTPDVHTLCVRGTDAAGNTSTEQCTFLAVYDPSAGFVTGGGWIDSPEGAYRPDPSLTGRATFGFVSKYQKGATVPSGKTEFQFHAGGLNFQSTSYDWLVVTGATGDQIGQFKGTGTINGSGSYKFMVWAGDKSTADTFRIKIWQDEGAVEVAAYDNGTAQPIGGGAIVVHKK